MSSSSSSPPVATPVACRSIDREGHPLDVTNVSIGFMRPLYSSCMERHNPSSLAYDEASHVHTSRVNELATMALPSPPPSLPRCAESSPFMRLPVELRLHIYSYLLLPSQATDMLPSFERVHSSTQDYWDYDKIQLNSLPVIATLDNPHIMIRTIEPGRFSRRFTPLRPALRRTQYSVRCDRFRSACKKTTYHCINTPRIENNLSILCVSKGINAECTDILYGSYTFDFDTHIEAIVPFLSDLTPHARSCIRSVRFVKRALPYDKEFDRCEWDNTLRYLTSPSSSLSLRRLELGVVAGRPNGNGWNGIQPYTAEYFRVMKDSGRLWCEQGAWMWRLFEFRGLKELEVSAVVEHCPPSNNSEAMEEYIRFSASVEGGFAEFLKGELLGANLTLPDAFASIHVHGDAGAIHTL